MLNEQTPPPVDWFAYSIDRIIYYDEGKKEETKAMDQYIVDNFPRTEDAVLVSKWLSQAIPTSGRHDFVDRMVLETIPGWQAKVLAEAKRLEEESKPKKS